MGRITLVPFLIAGIVVAAVSSCEAATVHLMPAVNHVPEDVLEGMRFLGDYEDFTVHVAVTGAVDPEPMYVAVHRYSRLLGAYFRAGQAQCWNKLGVVPCELPKETGLAALATPVEAWAAVPTSLGQPTPGQKTPQPGHPWRPWYPGHPWHPGWPGWPTEPGEPPVDPPIVNPPQPAPISLPPSGMFTLLGLFGLIFWKLLRFAGEYESFRAKCCNDPDHKPS